MLLELKRRADNKPINQIVIEGRIVDSIQGNYQNIGSAGSNGFNFNLLSGRTLVNVRFLAEADFFEKSGIKNKTFVIIHGELRDDRGDLYIQASIVERSILKPIRMESKSYESR